MPPRICYRVLPERGSRQGILIEDRRATGCEDSSPFWVKIDFFFIEVRVRLKAPPREVSIKANPVKLLPVLYEATADRKQWSAFLEGLSAQTDARVAALISRDERGQLGFVIQTGADPEAEKLYQQYYFGIDAFLALSEQRGFSFPGAVFPAQAYVSDQELARTEYGNDFLLKYGILRHCFALFGRDGVALSNLSLMRSSREQPFGEPALRVLRFLAPHVQQAIRLDERFTQLRLESEAKSAALNGLALGVVFLDAKGRVLGTNEAGTAILAQMDGLSVSKGHLKASWPNEDRVLQTAIFRSGQTGAARGVDTGGALLISRRQQAKSLQVVVGPACASMAAFSSCPAVVVFIHDLSARIRPRAEVLKTLYGLTAAEARVACLLLDGKSTQEITDILGTSKNTLKTQLQSIFGKTGVRRQSELIRTLMYLPTADKQH